MPEDGDVISSSDEELLKELKTGQTFYLRVFFTDNFLKFLYIYFKEYFIY